MGVMCAELPAPPVFFQSGKVHLVALTLEIGFMDRISDVHLAAHEPREVMFF